jgi:hypothetical protein
MRKVGYAFLTPQTKVRKKGPGFSEAFDSGS